MPSDTPTHYAIICPEHGQVFLTKQEYDAEMRNADLRWRCPICKEISNFDDENYGARVFTEQELENPRETKGDLDFHRDREEHGT